MTIKFSFGKCKTGVSYAARLMQKGTLNLNKIKKKYEVVMETPILLVVKVKGIEVIVHEHGKLLFKECQDVELMEKIVEEIYEEGLK